MIEPFLSGYNNSITTFKYIIMTAVIIGALSGLLTIMTIGILKLMDKPTIYGLVLSGIGFLYVGFTWTDLQALIVNAVQALFFLFLAYFGVKKSVYILSAGYFLHGIWDLIYNLFSASVLIPPHYDLFCLSIDFTIGFALLVIKYRDDKKLIPSVSF
jgi:hypothetical protein